MYDICCIGHITNDKVVTKDSVKFMPGGTAYYFTKALQHFKINQVLVTSIGSDEQYITDAMKKDGIDVTALPSAHTVFFENIYLDDQDHREQNVLETADPFSASGMPELSATIFHLGPLLANDIPIDLVKSLSVKGTVSLDVQGYLRTVENKKVRFSDWPGKEDALPYVSVLKANEFEMEILTGTSEIERGCHMIAAYGVKEVIITLGSKGSVIFTDGTFYEIPAFKPNRIVDATGCGDTYMAGYLSQKIRGASIESAALFGAAMATLKIQSSGPFQGNEESVYALLHSHSVIHTNKGF